ncbi:hypothetical protein SteCoe_26727 [Stentor coeruleus]|uniref:Uncharacterized protein n=1 Tax=Stentor coeruleus TaxID=5963 RepID=A0A1R2BC68_9CILI|nr:hypothetical protein SteCoe_26727 [Stentor coeruleus]
MLPLFTINKLLAPSGCAKTSRPLIDHIDIEIAETLKRQQLFDQEIEKEYSKLNFPIGYYTSEYKDQPASLKSSKFRFISKDAISKIDKSPKKKVKNNSVVKRRHRHRVENKSLDFNLVNFASPFEKLPPLIKSVPIHLDPKLQFPRKKSTYCEVNNAISHLSTVESVIRNCEKNNKTDFGSVERGIKYLKTETKDINNYLDDLVDSVKFSQNEEVIDNMMSTRKYNRKLDKSLRNESKNIQKELNETTKKLMKMGEFKHKKQKVQRKSSL